MRAFQISYYGPGRLAEAEVAALGQVQVVQATWASRTGCWAVMLGANILALGTCFGVVRGVVSENEAADRFSAFVSAKLAEGERDRDRDPHICDATDLCNRLKPLADRMVTFEEIDAATVARFDAPEMAL